MSTDVVGPESISIGDLVQHNDLHAFRPTYTVVEVVKVSPTRLSVKFPDGEVKSIGYTKTVDSGGWRGGRSRRTVFRKLDTEDLWRHMRPTTERIAVDYEGNLTIRREAMGDVAFVHAELDAIAHWLAAAPTTRTKEGE